MALWELSERPLTEKTGSGAKSNKEKYILKNEGLFDLARSEKRNQNCIFLKRGSFGAAQVKKVEFLGAAKAER